MSPSIISINIDNHLMEIVERLGTNIRYSLSPKLRFLIACPRSGSTCLMRIFNENEHCAVTSDVYGDPEFEADYSILQKPPESRIVEGKQFIISKEELSHDISKSESNYESLLDDNRYAFTKPAVVLRDPVRVYDSWKNVGWTSFESFIAAYKHLYEISRDGQKVYRIIYECMISDPDREIRKLCSWWGIPFYESMLKFHKSFEDFLSDFQAGTTRTDKDYAPRRLYTSNSVSNSMEYDGGVSVLFHLT